MHQETVHIEQEGSENLESFNIENAIWYLQKLEMSELDKMYDQKLVNGSVWCIHWSFACLID